MQLKKFREDFLQNLLNFVWRQWSALGVAGYGQENRSREWVIDPEALLLFSASVARYDQRLFDEVLDWLVRNERFLNVQRLKSIAKKEGFESTTVIKAMARVVVNEKSGLKWKGLAESAHTDTVTENLFFLKSGEKLPVAGKQDDIFHQYGFIRNRVELRGMSKIFPLRTVSGLLLQLRGLMGTNSRSDILLYLLMNGECSIQEIADRTHYAWRSVQDVLFEMGHSGIVSYPESKKGRTYYLKPEPWLHMLLGGKPEYFEWIGWSSLFRALEIILTTLFQSDFITMRPLEQAAEIKDRTDEDIASRIITAGFRDAIIGIEGLYGEAYLVQWVESIRGIMDILEVGTKRIT